MIHDKYAPLHSGFSFSGIRLSKDKKNVSPMRRQDYPSKRLRYRSINASEKNERRKRIMTEYDEEIDRRIGKGTIYQHSIKPHLFLKEMDDASKDDRFLYRFDPSNMNGVKSTKNSDGRQLQLRTLYGPGKFTVNKKFKTNRLLQDSIERVANINQISLLKLLANKQSRKAQQGKYFINISQIDRKSRNDSKSYSKGKKVEMAYLNKEDLRKFDKDMIQIDRNRRNNQRIDKNEKNQTDTVVTVKKKNEQNTIKVNSYDLTNQQQETFGDRFPYGYEKLKLLGRGGFSLVWLGQHKRSSKLFAIKQIITENNHQTHMKQIWFGSKFFTLGGLPRPEFAKHPGIRNLSKMYSYEINQKDTWIFYEKCGSSLGNCLYDIRGDKHNGQKVYKIIYKPLYYQIAQNINILKKIVIEIAKVLMLLAQNQIVHSDLKTENILIKHDEKDITQVKLIDYGSSFSFSQINQFSMATPQYMSHEILNYIMCENENEYDEQLLMKVKNYKNPWVVDIWSLGCVLLEIIHGVPLWMSLPLMVEIGGKLQKKFGLFAVKGRLFQQITEKQVEVVNNLDRYLQRDNFSGIKPDVAIIKVLKGMLELEPDERMSPKKVIEILTSSL